MGLVTGNWAYLPGAHLESTYDIRAAVRLPLAKDAAVGVEGAVQPLSTEGVGSAYLYF